MEGSENNNNYSSNQQYPEPQQQYPPPPQPQQQYPPPQPQQQYPPPQPQQQYPPPPPQPIKIDKSTKKLLLMIFVIGFVLVFIFALAYKPEWQQYEMYDSGQNTVWKNDNLDTQITKTYETNIWGEGYYTYSGKTPIFSGVTPNDLLNDILEHSTLLSENQIKWYEYMCENVID